MPNSMDEIDGKMASDTRFARPKMTYITGAI